VVQKVVGPLAPQCHAVFLEHLDPWRLKFHHSLRESCWGLESRKGYEYITFEGLWIPKVLPGAVKSWRVLSYTHSKICVHLVAPSP
jgi:hypothetical protein